MRAHSFLTSFGRIFFVVDLQPCCRPSYFKLRLITWHCWVFWGESSSRTSTRHTETERKMTRSTVVAIDCGRWSISLACNFVSLKCWTPIHCLLFSSVFIYSCIIYCLFIAIWLIKQMEFVRKKLTQTHTKGNQIMCGFCWSAKNKHKYVHFDFYFHFYSGYLFNNIIIGYEWRINNSLFFLSRTHQSVNAPASDCVRFFASTLFGVRSHLDKGDKIWYSFFFPLWRTTSATIRVYKCMHEVDARLLIRILSIRNCQSFEVIFTYYPFYFFCFVLSLH